MPSTNEELGLVEFIYHRPRIAMTGYGRGKAHAITIQGIRGDHIFEQVRQTRSFYENDLLERIDLLTGNRASVIIDVGANIGNHAIFFSKVLGARVVCFEPNPIAVKLLRSNLELNGVTEQVTIMQVAASDCPGLLQLKSGATSNLGTTKVFEGKHCGDAEVAAGTLDDTVTATLTSRHERIALIKIDVEGFEVRVLLGALKTIEDHLPLIVIEAATLDDRLAIDGMLYRFGYHRLGPFCATPTYIYCQSRRVCVLARVRWCLLRALRYV